MKSKNTLHSSISTRRFILSIFLLNSVFYSFGQQTINGTLEFDGIERDYILYVPASYSEGNPVPLVFNFHGYTSNAGDQAFYGNFTRIADKEGFLVVHPQGTKDFNGINHFNVDWGNSNVDDVGFTNALIDKIISEYSVDEKRLYSTGFSNGGFMSYKLACELSTRIAAVASVSGTVTKGQFAACDPSHQMPILHIHGTNDATVAYEGDLLFESVSSVLDFWVDFNNLPGGFIKIDFPNTNMDDGSTVELTAYQKGDNGAVVEHYRVIDGGHTWPGGAPLPRLVTNDDINASEVIWKFFSRFDIDGEINQLSIDEVTDNRIQLQSYPIPSNGTLIIEHSFSRVVPFSISSLQGNIVSEGHLTSKKESIDITALSAGVYFLNVENTAYKIVKR